MIIGILLSILLGNNGLVFGNQMCQIEATTFRFS